MFAAFLACVCIKEEILDKVQVALHASTIEERTALLHKYVDCIAEIQLFVSYEAKLTMEQLTDKL